MASRLAGLPPSVSLDVVPGYEAAADAAFGPETRAWLARVDRPPAGV